MATWFITGCSTGFGRALAETVLAGGDSAIVTARDPAKVADLEEQFPGRALALVLDVTKPEQIEEAAARALDEFGRVDVLVNNAVGIAGRWKRRPVRRLRRSSPRTFSGPSM